MENEGLKVVEDRDEEDNEPQEGVNTVLQILGKVRTDAEVSGEPLDNSTRWIFDVDQCSPEIRVQLAFKYSRQGKGELLRSYSLAPLSPGFWDAKVWLEEEVDEDGNETLVLHAYMGSEPSDLGTDPRLQPLKPRPRAVCKYRVAIDTIHTSTR